MDLQSEIFAFLSASARRIIRLQRAGADSLAQDDQRGSSIAQRLVRAYDAELEQIERRALQFAEARDSETREGAIVEMRTRVAAMRGLQWTMAWTATRAHAPLDLGTTYFLDRVSHDLVQREADAIVVIQSHEYGYATVLQQFFDSLPPGGLDGDPVPVVVFVPSLEQSATLLHPIIVHEVAHAAVSCHDLDQVLVGRLVARFPLAERVDAAARQMASATVSEDEARHRLHSQVRSWATELLCDALAVAYVGPTYVWGFASVVVEAAALEASPTHPPAGGRIKSALDALRRNGWDPVIEADERLLTTLSAAEWPERAGLHPAAALLVDAGEAMAPMANVIAESHLGGRRFTQEQFSDVEEQLRVMIAAEVPPSQDPHGEAIDRRAILLSGWQEGVSQCGGGVAALVGATELDGLNRLLAQALEMSAFVAAWREA